MSEKSFILVIFDVATKNSAGNVVDYLMKCFPERSRNKLLDTLLMGRSIVLRGLSDVEAGNISSALRAMGARVERRTR